MEAKLLPTSLRKYANLIADVSDERQNGDGYWVYLISGRVNTLHEVHFVHEDTPQECAKLFKLFVDNCHCSDCEHDRKEAEKVAAQKKQLVEGYAKTYIAAYDRGDVFGANNVKFQCCVTFYFCEQAQFDRIVSRLRKEAKDSQYRFENGTLYELRGDAYVCCYCSRAKTKQAAIRQYESL